MSSKSKSKFYRYTQEEKKSLIEDYLKSGLNIRQYSLKSTVSEATLGRWVRELSSPKERKIRHYSQLERKQAIEEFVKSGMTAQAFSKAWGVSESTINKWYSVYKKHGAEGLESGAIYGTKKKRGRKSVKQEIKDKIIIAKKSLPEHGLKKLRDFLYRFEGVKVAPNTIKKVLKEEELFEPPPPAKKKSPPLPRRFERANPMQLWQSDITSFVLRRTGKRVYLVVFKDDHSRYIVAWSLAMKQTGKFVMECYLDGVQKFGKPQEVLTDQGRQYFSWRGKSEFQKLLETDGVRHVVSRSHHPQTLGKCERFWKNVGQEFWNRAKPEELNEARERFSHYVNHYNHFRPHQGINGMTPADRFFGVESDVKKAIEDNLSRNELRLSIDQAPRKPFYFVGQIGEKRVAIHGEKGKLQINTPDGDVERMSYDDFGSGYTKTTRTSGENSSQYSNASEEEKERTQERELQDASSASDTCEGTVASSERGREEARSLESGDNHGVLDGSSLERRSSEEVGSSGLENMADESASGVGNVCGTVKATEDEEGYGEQGRRSEIPEKEDQRARRDDRDSREIDHGVAGDAGLQTRDLQTGPSGAEEAGSFGEREISEEEKEENRSETWQEAKSDTTGDSESGWWGTYLKKKDE